MKSSSAAADIKAAEQFFSVVESVLEFSYFVT